MGLALVLGPALGLNPCPNSWMVFIVQYSDGLGLTVINPLVSKDPKGENDVLMNSYFFFLQKKNELRFWTHLPETESMVIEQSWPVGKVVGKFWSMPPVAQRVCE